MVRTLEKSDSPGFSMNDKEEQDEKDDNLWTSILSEVQTRGSTKLPSCKSVLVLGDNESGKTTLIAKLQGVEDPKKGSGLEYAYIDVRDEYREDHTRLSVWVLDGEPSHAHLLRFALTPASFPHTLVMFVVAMTTPWSLLEQLENWATVLHDHIDRLKIPPDQLQEYRQKCTRRWQEYVDQGEDLDLDSPLRRTSRNLDGDDGVDGDVFPLGEGVLTRNLGLDIVVVVTKTDYMSTLEKESDYRDEYFDFIQQWIRRFCLQYGAGLFYTSAKEDKNCDLLYKYLTHRIYSFPFRTPALVVEKDAVLIPSGWDSMKKISILFENMQSMKPDDYYRDVIAPPVTRKTVTRESEIQAEEEQSFLSKQQALLQQGAPPMSRQESPMRSPAGVQKTGDRRMQGSPSMDPTKPGAAGSGEGVLANFFNSLLHKKTGAAGSPSSLKSPNDLSTSPAAHSPVDKAAMRSDAAAELDRLTRKKPPPPPQTPLITLNNSSSSSPPHTPPDHLNNSSEC
ncbi:cytoplasmic dynein 1 light intermediate chain 2 isoform X2 [Nilaparvata lugens]|uniref:cytoplasmic dynein 1 light intermediate chain 2 isoform X2 n=1 Tax=Nilaparvata lugens TaxID=108931 RepID=UPI00193E48BA|nr:cytoplasmic dynein 1 light intermediate chain 2 isoform X2 [Nilaparvata lugens]